MKLVSNWREAPRWVSMKCMAAAVAIQSMWGLIPPDMKASIPPAGVTALTVALLVLGVIGRLVDQTKTGGVADCKPEDSHVGDASK